MWWRQLQSIDNWRARAPALLSIVLAALVLLDLLRSIESLSRPLPNLTLPAALPAAPQVQPASDLQSITAAHLFGIHVAGEDDAAAAAETTQPLVLSGIIASDDPKAGRAILAEPGKAAHVYRPGADLIGARHVRLFEVLLDRVVLQIDGQLETLRLHRDRTSAAAAGMVRTAVIEVDAAPVQAVAEQDARMPPTPAEDAFQVLHAANATGGGMQLHPEMRYKRSFGLRDGDILTAVNGVPTTDDEALHKTLRSSTDALSLTVMRNGVVQTVNVTIDE
jgi:type II secretion system protein C